MDVPSRRSVFRSLGAALLAGSGLSTGLAQDVIDPAPTSVPVRVYSGSGPVADFLANAPYLLRWGPIVARPRIGYNYTYSDGVRAGPDSVVSTSRQRFTFGLAAQVSRRWNVDYAASWNTYSSDEFSDAIEHSFGVSGALAYELWSASLTHRSSFTDAPQIETARQIKQEQHNTSIRVARPLSQNLAADVELGQRLRYVDQAPNVYDHTVTPSLSYRFNPTLIAYTGVEFGWTDVTNSGIDMRHQRPQVGVDWRVSQRLSASGFVGRERRTFVDSPTPRQESTSYGATVSYQVSPLTSLSGSAARQAGASYLSQQLSETTSFSLDVQQRVFRGISLGAGVTWAEVDYTLVTTTLPIVRTDERTSYYARLSTQFLRNGSVGIGWRRSKNDSSQGGFAFNSDQYTLDVSYAF